MFGFLAGKKDLFDYWGGTHEGEASPYCLFLTSDAGTETPDSMRAHLSPDGETWTIDYMIGSVDHVGRGLGSRTLSAFCSYLESTYPNLGTFLIDPAATNVKAVHVYANAGFEKVGEYVPSSGSFAGIRHDVMRRYAD